jgi:hypothetical protein
MLTTWLVHSKNQHNYWVQVFNYMFSFVQFKSIWFKPTSLGWVHMDPFNNPNSLTWWNFRIVKKVLGIQLSIIKFGWNCGCDSNPSSIMLGLENACDLMGNFVSMSLIITTIWVFFYIMDVACWQEAFQL